MTEEGTTGDLLGCAGWECPKCGFFGYVYEDERKKHRCYGDGGDLEIRITQFLNRWHWRGEPAVVRAELEALIAEARKS